MVLSSICTIFVAEIKESTETKKIMKKKQMYQKPAMQVIELPCRQQLLQGSTRATRQVYGDANQDVPDADKEDGVWVWN